MRWSGSCHAASDGTVTASAKLTNVAVHVTALGVDVRLLTLDANPTPNAGLNVLSIATLLLDAQSSTGTGNVRATALHVGLVASLVSADVGVVNCGTNVRAAPAPAIPPTVLPPALAAAVAATVSPAGRRLILAVRGGRGSGG